MPNLEPKPYQVKPNQEITAKLLNKITALADRSLRGDGTVLVQDYGDRVTLTFGDSKPTLPAVNNYLQQFVVLEELDDLLLCTPYNPCNNGQQVLAQLYSSALGKDALAQVYIAKPYVLQRTPWNGSDVYSQHVPILPNGALPLPLDGNVVLGFEEFIQGYVVQQDLGSTGRTITPAAYYSTPGNLNIQVQPFQSYLAEAWGGGADGDAGTGNGGGGGSYASISGWIPPVTVASLSTGTSPVAASVGGSSQASWIESPTLVLANGAIGQTGGIAGVGSVVNAGGDGGAGTSTLGGGGGGSGTLNGPGYSGGAAQDSNGTNIPYNGSGGMGYGLGGSGGNDGAVAGGGGGGGCPGAPSGGSGAPGQLRISNPALAIPQVIEPAYAVGEIIMAARAVTGYYSPSDSTQSVVWADINTAGRTWKSAPVNWNMSTFSAGGEAGVAGGEPVYLIGAPTPLSGPGPFPATDGQVPLFALGNFSGAEAQDEYYGLVLVTFFIETTGPSLYEVAAGTIMTITVGIDLIGGDVAAPITSQVYFTFPATTIDERGFPWSYGLWTFSAILPMAGVAGGAAASGSSDIPSLSPSGWDGPSATRTGYPIGSFWMTAYCPGGPSLNGIPLIQVGASVTILDGLMPNYLGNDTGFFP